MAFLDTETQEAVEAMIAAEPSVDPGTSVSLRRTPAPRIWRYPAERNVRPVEAVGAQRAPDPIRQGDTPARPARMPIITFLAIRPIKAVMSDEFRVRVLAPNHTAAIPSQGQLPFQERANIRRPAAEAYGSLFTLDPGDPFALL